jgi:cell division protein FtsB
VSAGTRTLERDRPRLTGRAAGLLVVVATLALLSLVPARQFLAQRGRIADLERQADLLERQNGDLRMQIVQLKDPAELERLARECLGMVRPGEIALVVPDAPASDGC